MDDDPELPNYLSTGKAPKVVPKAAETPEEKDSRIQEERNDLLRSVAEYRVDTLERKVAWVLNHYPDARDSDITLQLKFWSHFDAISVADSGATVSDFYDGTRLTSLARARAKVQNTYKLFHASPSVRKKRGQLSEEERERHAEDAERYPSLAVYSDESGKEQDTLVVGSVWFLMPSDMAHVQTAIEAWKARTQFPGELHFSSIKNGNLNRYLDFLAFLKTQSAVITFRAITARNSGHSHVEPVLETMTYHLLMRGVEQEHTTGRAPLPRNLFFAKDDAEAGRDQVTLSELRDRVELAAMAKFPGQLTLGDFIATKSKDSSIIQCADLYTGAVSRFLNYPGQSGAKDTFAATFLQTFGAPEPAQLSELIDGITVTLSL